MKNTHLIKQDNEVAIRWKIWGLLNGSQYGGHDRDAKAAVAFIDSLAEHGW